MGRHACANDPIGALVDALVALGAQTGYEQAAGFPPLNVVARGLAGGEVAFQHPAVEPVS